MERSDRIERALAATRRRLRLRSVTRAVAAAAHPALLLAIGIAVVGRLLALPRPLIGLAALVAVSGIVAAAAAVGMLVRGLDRRSLALLVDRLGGTDETVLTALHVAEAGGADPNRDAILDRFERLSLAPRELLPVRPPRHLRWVPLEALVAALCLALVPPVLTWPFGGSAGPVAREAERLEERLAELEADQPEGVVLPEDIERELAELADDLRDGDLTADEARERMAELQEQLETFEQRLAPSADLLRDLEQAAQQLQGEGTERLSDALRDGDMAAAAEAARDLSESLAEATPEERQRAAEALQQAGEALKQSPDPSLQRAGEAMRSAGQQVADASSDASQPAAGDRAGNPGPDGKPGSEPAGGPQGAQSSGSGLSPQQAAQLAQELQQAQSLGQQLAQDQAALQRSQALNGALEGSRQRLGGDPQVAGGESSSGRGQGQGEPSGQGQSSGDGDGQGTGAGQGDPNGSAGAANGVGTSGHTWEDQGEFSGGSSEGPRDRFSDRRGGTHVDDFEKLYQEMRLAGAQSLLAGVDGQVDDQGHVDQLPIRITTGDEDATAPSVEMPAAFRDQAVEAIEAEPVPPAYEQAVKRYFDVR
jgi:hypothetical protein